MAEAHEQGGPPAIAFQAYGVRGAVEAASPALLERASRVLPPGWQPCPAESVEHRFGLVPSDTGTYAYAYNGEVMHQGLDLDLAIEILDAQIRLVIGVEAPDTIFIHAGVVAHRDRALVLPGRSFSGKTSLVAALVRAGAIYLSDEFAVLDSDGLVHPYAKPLSLRAPGMGAQTDHSVESLGGVAGDTALPVGLVAITTYRAGAEWRPERLSVGEGAMGLLENAVPARERPAQVLRAISQAIQQATVLRGDRGEAETVAPLLLAELDRSGD